MALSLMLCNLLVLVAFIYRNFSDSHAGSSYASEVPPSLVPTEVITSSQSYALTEYSSSEVDVEKERQTSDTVSARKPARAIEPIEFY